MYICSPIHMTLLAASEIMKSAVMQFIHKVEVNFYLLNICNRNHAFKQILLHFKL